jgi:predicted transcriptional regulator
MNHLRRGATIPRELPLDGRGTRATMYYVNTLSVRIPDELRADLLEISSRQSVPVSDLVRESIRRYVAIERFRALRKRALRLAEAQGFLTDEDVFRAIS